MMAAGQLRLVRLGQPMGHGRHQRRYGDAAEPSLRQPGPQLLIREDPAVVRCQRHVDREDGGESRRGTRGVGHHVHHIDHPAGLQGLEGSPEQFSDRIRGFLVQDAEEDRRVVPLGQFEFSLRGVAPFLRLRYT